jgi:ATP-dependent Clp protease ATP-binding subunit ClpC
VFERFTERARHSVAFAQDEARSLRHNYIGTEHLLLGLLREEDGLAARALTGLDVHLDQARAEVASIIGEGDVVREGQIPFTPRAKKVLELGLREALSHGHNYIGTEHLLLAVARENDGVAAQVLLGLGVGSEAIRDAVESTLGQTPTIDVRPRSGARLRVPSYRRRDAAALVVGWSLFAVAMGFGLLLGWLIWG